MRTASKPSAKRPAIAARPAGAAAAASSSRRIDVRAAKAAERRSAILKAALDEFSERGFAAARLDDVARRAGVAKGTIYLYFADKEALFQELVRSQIGPVVGALEAALASDLPLRSDRRACARASSSAKSTAPTASRCCGSSSARDRAFPRSPNSTIARCSRTFSRRCGHGSRGRSERGEIAGDALVRFPQLLGAPGIVAIVWSGLFDRFEPLDVRAMMRAYFDRLFGPRSAP